MIAYKVAVVFIRDIQERRKDDAFPFDAIFTFEHGARGYGWEMRLPIERPDVFRIGASYVLSIDEHIAE